jgi:HPt (histidine-containing phosphotransfer) domain-containing protein
MLSRLETMSINPNIKHITDAVNEQDFDKMKAKIHNMKGACGYVGASRLHYVCAFI